MAQYDFLIVDDEELARLRIEKYLKEKYPHSSIRQAEDGIAACEAIHDRSPDIVFLDIEMPELNGFEVLRNFEMRDFLVIFQTAYDDFAIKAFEVNACDYILKPFGDDRLQAAIDKAISRLPEKSEDKREDRLLDDYMAQQERYLSRFSVKVGNRTKVIDQDEVRYFLSESHVTRIFLKDIDYAYSNSLTYLEKQLDPGLFLRLHRNNIVKLSELKMVHHGPNTTIELKDGTELPVSREQKAKLKQILD